MQNIQRVAISESSVLRFLRGFPQVASPALPKTRLHLRDFLVRYEEHCADVERAAKSPLTFAGAIQPKANQQKPYYPPFYQKFYDQQPVFDSAPKKQQPIAVAEETPKKKTAKPATTPVREKKQNKEETRQNK